MLRLSGMSIKIQILTKRVMEAVFLTPTIICVALIGKLLVTPFISFGVLFLLILFVFIQFVLIQDIFSYGFGRGPLAASIKVIYFIFMFLITTLKTLFSKNIKPGQVYFYCALFPTEQLQYFLLLAEQLYSANSSIKINIGTLDMT
jgi:hypothetical protein